MIQVKVSTGTEDQAKHSYQINLIVSSRTAITNPSSYIPIASLSEKQRKGVVTSASIRLDKILKDHTSSSTTATMATCSEVSKFVIKQTLWLQQA